MITTTTWLDAESIPAISLSGHHHEIWGDGIDLHGKFGQYGVFDDGVCPATPSTATPIRLELEQGETWENVFDHIHGEGTIVPDRDDWSDEESDAFIALEKEANLHIREILSGEYPRFPLITVYPETDFLNLELEFACPGRDDCHLYISLSLNDSFLPEDHSLKLRFIGPKDTSGFEPIVRSFCAGDCCKFILHISPTHRQCYTYDISKKRGRLEDYTNF